MRVIALDLDGTLIDCMERQSLLASSLCRGAGFKLNLQEFWEAKREGATTMLAICNQINDARFASWLSRLWVNQIESENWLRIDRVLPGVMRALHEASKHGFFLHLITARANERGLRRQLLWLSLNGIFHHIEVVSPIDASKQKANYLSSIKPIAYIGDSESDAAAAFSAQVKFFAVTSGQRSSTYFQTHTNLQARDIKPDLQEAIREILYADD